MRPPSAGPENARDLLASLALGVGYGAIAALTLRYTRFEGGVAFVWPATALLLASLLQTPRERWAPRLAACWVAGAVTTALFGLGSAVAPAMASINIAEAWGGAWLLIRIRPRSGEFRSLTDVGIFIAVASGLAPAVTALFAGACAAAATQTGYWPNVADWYAGHALGAVIVAPLLLLSLGPETSGLVRDAGRRGIAEAVALLALVAGTAVFVFAQTRLPLLFLPFLPMMIAVFRLGHFGALASTVLVALTGAVLTMNGLGPVNLIVGGTGSHAQFLQFYLATAVLVVLPAAAELNRRKALFTALQDTSALQQLVLDRTSDIIMRLELDGTIAYVSPSIKRVGGYTPEQLIGRQPQTLIAGEDVEAVVRTHRQALASPSETFIVEYRARREDGGMGWFETHTRATVDEAGCPTGAVSIIHEITSRKQAVADLERQASTDALTGLANRRAFDARLALMLAAAADAPEASGCMAIFDLDRFKTINDRHGHATGDMVLKQFAELLRTAVRGNDMVARFGGEEFIALLGGASSEEASAVCERVRRRFETLDIRDGQGAKINATVSAGLTRINARNTADDLLNAADAALYRSKMAGRNRLTLAA